MYILCVYCIYKQKSQGAGFKKKTKLFSAHSLLRLIMNLRALAEVEDLPGFEFIDNAAKETLKQNQKQAKDPSKFGGQVYAGLKPKYRYRP